MLSIFLSLIPLLISSLHRPEDYVVFQWCMGLGCLSALLIFVVFERASITFSLLFGFILIYCVYTILLRENHFSDLNDGLRVGYAFSAAIQALCLLIVTFSLLFLKGSHLERIKDTLPWYGAINALYVIYTYLFGVRLTGSMGIQGFLDYSGMNGCLLAVTATSTVAQFLDGKFKKLFPVFVVLSLIAIYLSKGSIAYGVLVCGLAAVLISHFKVTKKTLLLCAAAVILIIGIGLFAEGIQLFDSGRRFEAYDLFMSYWADNGRWFLGEGPGAFQVRSKIIQERAGFMADGKIVWVWLWMHSDWLQAVWEYGVFGAILLVITVTHSLYTLCNEKRTELFGVGCALASCAIFNYPARYFVTAFLCTYVVVCAQRLKELKELSTSEIELNKESIEKIEFQKLEV